MTTATIPTDCQPRAWVGCLACYNEGRLIGEWLDRDQLETFCGKSTAAGLRSIGCKHPAAHEETWVMDHECFAGALKGECSPPEALKLMEFLAEVAETMPEVPVPVVVEYIQLYAGYPTVTDVTLANVRDAFIGEYDSPEDYAQDALSDYMAPKLDQWGHWDDRTVQTLIESLPDWLSIDWAHSAAQFLADESVVEHEGRIYIFASI